MKCSFGCGNDAVVTFKSGKTCCSKSTSSCPAMKSKNSAGVKKIREEKKENFWKNGHPKGSSKGTSLKGKTYEQIHGEKAEERKKHLSEKAKGNKNYSNMSDEAKHNHANKARTNILKRYESGWMPKAGRCKKIKYVSPIAGEMFVDGTWEHLVVQWLDYKQYSWRRNTKRFPYTHLTGRLSHYTPDFFVEEFNGYLEIKGYETALDRCKWSQFNENITVWKKKELQEIRKELKNLGMVP